MKATVVNKRGITFVSFEGHLNYAHSEILKTEIKQLLERKRNQKIVFNFEKLQFVGSSGIRPFIAVLRVLNNARMAPRYYGVAPEFQRLFETYRGHKRFKIFSDEKEAIRSYRIVKKAARA